MERQEIRPRPEWTSAGDRPTSESRLAEILASDAERAQVIDLLQKACVEGRLTLEEFAQRAELAQAARTRGELEVITRDLPTASVVTTRPRQTPVSSALAILSEDKRQGNWVIAEKCTAFAFMGSCKLDLRNATISAPVTTIEAATIMGSIEIVVPEGVEVDLDVVAVMGAKNLKLQAGHAAPGAPLIRVTGFVLMGEVTVRDHPSFGERVREMITGKSEW